MPVHYKEVRDNAEGRELKNWMNLKDEYEKLKR